MRRMLSNCEPATTCSHSAPGPLTLTHTGLSHSCNANTSAPTADPVANASAYRLGRTQNPMPARVMKKLAVTVGPDRPGPNVAVRCCRAAHHMTCEPRDFARVQARVNNQPAGASHHTHRRFDHRHRAGACRAVGVDAHRPPSWSPSRSRHQLVHARPAPTTQSPPGRRGLPLRSRMSALRTGGVTVVRLGTSGRATAHITGRHSWIRRLVLASVQLRGA